MLLGEVFPNEEVKTTEGTIKLHDYFGDKWGVFFTHPAGIYYIATV